jgi:HK97 family phage major capsid protein
LEARAAKKAEAEAITELANSEKRELTADEAEKFDKLIAEVGEMDGHIERARKAEDVLKKRAVDAPAIITAPGDPATPTNEKRSFSLMRAVQLRADGKNIDGFEGEVVEEGVKNARMNGIDITSDAFYVPADYLQTWTDRNRTNYQCWRPGW